MSASARPEAKPNSTAWLLRDPATGRVLSRAEAEVDFYRQFLDFGTEAPPHDNPDLPPGALTAVQLWKQVAIWQDLPLPP